MIGGIGDPGKMTFSVVPERKPGGLFRLPENVYLLPLVANSFRNLNTGTIQPGQYFRELIFHKGRFVIQLEPSEPFLIVIGQAEPGHSFFRTGLCGGSVKKHALVSQPGKLVLIWHIEKEKLAAGASNRGIGPPQKEIAELTL